MDKKICVIIDNDPQEENFKENICTPLRQEFDISLIYINPNHPDFEGNDGMPDMQKVNAHIHTICSNSKIHIFASDLNYNISTFSGLDIISEFRTYNKRTPVILYSANIKRAITSIIAPFMEKQITPEQAITQIELLTTTNKYVNGKRYYEAVIRLIKKPEDILTDILLQNLKEHSEIICQSCYPKFQGRNFGEIAHEIECNSPHGIGFQNSIIEQTLAYLADIHNEDK